MFASRPMGRPFILALSLCAVAANAQDFLAGGYEQGAIFTDGPIIYGTGMSDQDRRDAWAHFFLMMAQAVNQQQGRKALDAKLVRRCLPHQNFCTTTLDAWLVGNQRHAGTTKSHRHHRNRHSRSEQTTQQDSLHSTRAGKASLQRLGYR
jgi:hypothetical protein